MIEFVTTREAAQEYTAPEGDSGTCEMGGETGRGGGRSTACLRRQRSRGRSGTHRRAGRGSLCLRNLLSHRRRRCAGGGGEGGQGSIGAAGRRGDRGRRQSVTARSPHVPPTCRIRTTSPRRRRGELLTSQTRRPLCRQSRGRESERLRTPEKQRLAAACIRSIAQQRLHNSGPPGTHQLGL